MVIFIISYILLEQWAVLNTLRKLFHLICETIYKAGMIVITTFEMKTE